MPRDPHTRYERKQVAWLFVSFAIIAAMTAAVMLYAAVQTGWRRP